MTSSKRIIQHAALLFCMLLIGNASIANAADATATVRITATFVAPTCALEVPSTVYLGSIRNGTQTYNPFSFRVNCTTPTQTAVYAEAKDELAPGSNDTVLMRHSKARFWLKDETSNQNITLNGEGGDVFCAGTSNRNCTLTPNTTVKPETPRGETSTIIKFNIRYEA